MHAWNFRRQVVVLAGFLGLSGALSLTAQPSAAQSAVGSTMAAPAAQMAQGKQLFLQGVVPSCAVCHTLADAGAEGAVGPVLDELKPDAARVAKALRTGIGAMPSFRDKLSDEQIEALSVYVAKASSGTR